MLAVKTEGNWLLETAETHYVGLDGRRDGPEYRAWVSNPDRFVYGFSCNRTLLKISVRAAIAQARFAGMPDADSAPMLAYSETL